MNIRLLITISILIISLPVYALDCNKKPCHKKCISSQPDYVQIQCWCNSRKKVYYRYWHNDGVPEYNEVCDGTFEQYAVNYCAAKRRYDGYLLNNKNFANTYTPQYDPICDGSEAEYLQKIQVLKQNQAINNMADALRQPVQVNVNHSGTTNHNVQLNGTIRHQNYWYSF